MANLVFFLSVYSVGFTSDYSKPILSSREVSGSLKKLRIKLVAASKFHTVVCTETQLFTWGQNNGQLGYTLPIATIQAFPKKVVMICEEILQISATNSATAILSQSKDVYVYAQGSWQKVLFPTLYNNISTKVHAPVQQKYHRINKLTSGNHQFAAINAQGDVYLWSPPEDHRFADTWQQQTFPQRKPKIIWAIRKNYLAARDVAVGIDSSILIRTDSGHVYYGVR
jgi:alpha-tubulin suppressor-like RCC1 family protein